MKISFVPTWLQEFEKEAGYMTKQSEIRKGVAKYFERTDYGWSALDYADKVLSYLDSQGAVLKKERKEVAGCSIVDNTNAICPYKEAGYEAVEPLI